MGDFRVPVSSLNNCLGRKMDAWISNLQSYKEKGSLTRSGFECI